VLAVFVRAPPPCEIPPCFVRSVIASRRSIWISVLANGSSTSHSPEYFLGFRPMLLLPQSFPFLCLRGSSAISWGYFFRPGKMRTLSLVFFHSGLPPPLPNHNFFLPRIRSLLCTAWRLPSDRLHPVPVLLALWVVSEDDWKCSLHQFRTNIFLSNFASVQFQA